MNAPYRELVVETPEQRRIRELEYSRRKDRETLLLTVAAVRLELSEARQQRTGAVVVALFAVAALVASWMLFLTGWTP